MSRLAPSPSFLALASPVCGERLVEFRQTAAEAVRSGAEQLIVDLDGLALLDSATIAALIATLRDAREAGAAMSLAVSRKPLLDTLKITGLDKIFEIVAPEAHTPEPPPEPRTNGSPKAAAPKARARARFAAAVLGAIVTFGSLGATGVAQDEPTPAAIVQHVVDANPSLRTYQARVHVNVQMQSFPFLAPTLEGTTYFKRPNNFEVQFDRVPSYAKGFERLYSDIGDPTSWERRFNMTVAGERQVSGHRDVIVRLVQKVRGMIDHQDVAIDPATWHVDQMEWHYYTGGVIAMTQHFQEINGSSVLAEQHATIRIPHIRAIADAHYSDYRTNVAIDDAVFTRSSR